MTVIKFKRGLATSWASSNLILAEGEAGFETDTGQMKLGDGVRAWNDLAYTGAGAMALDGHINSSSPHPIYDDGPSLILLYENAKV